MDRASEILSDIPFKEVNLLNELDHMEHSCGRTDAATSTTTPCLGHQRVPNAGPLLPGSQQDFTRARAGGRLGDTQLPAVTPGSPPHRRCGRGLVGERKQDRNFAGSLENLGRSGRCFVVFLTRTVKFL